MGFISSSQTLNTLGTSCTKQNVSSPSLRVVGSFPSSQAYSQSQLVALLDCTLVSLSLTLSIQRNDVLQREGVTITPHQHGSDSG
jgi:hypothetical protein